MTDTKFGFVHVPRTAGGSLVNALMETNWIILGHDEPSKHYMHLSEFRAHHPLKDIHLIATLRNPYDRLVSAYHFLMQGGDNEKDKRDAESYLKSYPDFETFVIKGLNFWNRNKVLRQVHFRPQSFWITKRNRILVDQIFNFEELENLFEFVVNNSDLTRAQIGHTHASKRSNFEEYYSERMKKNVQQVYRKDFEIGNYQF